MCGICGAIDWTDSGTASRLVRRMTPTMVHRGPDDEGYFETGPVALGMRRLSIIDLNGGHQPIFNEDGSVGVVLNGEIYNFRDLRKQLQDRNHKFSTRSDSEVIAHAYEEWGADCVEHLDGMFAFAVYDRRDLIKRSAPKQGTLFLARDRLGIKPLYYYGSIAHYLTSGSEPNDLQLNSYLASDAPMATANRKSIQPPFIFASEVRTLLASGVVPHRLSQSALKSFLLFGSVSEPETLVEGVFSLPPGYRITIQLEGEYIIGKPEQYWNIAASTSSNGHSATNGSRNIVAYTSELLKDSIRKHLVADVPVGIFLSSGIDSTALTALASREVTGVHTFTVGFPEAEFSETNIAKRTAARFHTTHQELILDGDEMLARLSEAVGALDQPSMDGINTYFVSWGARQAGLKVALSGLGADEIFGGYSNFHRTPQYQRIASWGDKLPGSLRRAFASALTVAGRGLIPGDPARKIAALCENSASLPHAYYFARTLFTPPQVDKLLRSDPGKTQNLWWNWLASNVEATHTMDHFRMVSCLEARSYLVNTLLRDTDSMSMAHSLEVRVPFLDHSLVEFVTQLSEDEKLRDGTPKALLVEALRKCLPEEVVCQAKRGFTFPWAHWLRGPLRKKIEQGLSELSPAIADVLRPKEALQVWKSYLAGQTSWARPWSLYVLNEWAKRNLVNRE